MKKKKPEVLDVSKVIKAQKLVHEYLDGKREQRRLKDKLESILYELSLLGYGEKDFLTLSS